MASDAAADRRPVATEEIIMTDRAGRVTTDPERAAAGEVVTVYANGDIEHTLFTVPTR